MRLIRTILNWGHDRLAVVHCPNIRALPKMLRIMHPRSRRHLVGTALGAAVMLTGSAMATNASEVGAWLPFHAPHFLIDAVAYFLHGIGAIPFVSHVEPLWKLLMTE